MRTACSKRANSKILCISTQGDPESPDNQFERLKGSADYVQVHAADKDDDPLSDKALKAANPGLGTILPLKGVQAIREEAKRDPATMRAFKAFNLNMPSSDISKTPLLSAEQWKTTLIGEDEELPPKVGTCYAGIDLGESESMSAVTLYWPQSFRLECHGFFCRTPSLLERGQLDGVGRLYEEAHKDGEITYSGIKIVAINEFLAWIQNAAPGALLIGDKFRSNELEEHLPDYDLEWTERRTSNLVSQADIRQLWRRVAEGKIKTKRSRIMTMGLKGASLHFDTSGNPKLDKRQRIRVDTAQALIMSYGWRCVLFGDSVAEEGDFGGW